jgi:3-oxoacid CoA-transferase
MATRRLSTAYFAGSVSARNGILRASLPRRTIRPPPSLTRSLQTTACRYEQQANTKAKRDPAPKVDRGASKLFKSADAAVADIEDGATILSSGFGLCGTAGQSILRHMTVAG